jgi:putative Mg2+ transporter-C (MgtC) family protein
MMREYLIVQMFFLLKLTAAGACGAAIGYERKNRLKEAGIRTHMLVAIGAALIMIISQYGFADLVKANGYSFDPSRIAAQIVTGIGFLGAGMIFVKKQTINGLTTAAGIWATAGIGMAIGAGMYLAGIFVTIFVFIIQTLLHRNFKLLKLPVTKQVIIRVKSGSGVMAYIREKLRNDNIEIIDLKASKEDGGNVEIDMYLKLPYDYDEPRLLDMLTENKDITSIEY